jgi:hypothetical protein
LSPFIALSRASLVRLDVSHHENADPIPELGLHPERRRKPADIVDDTRLRKMAADKSQLGDGESSP